MFYHIMTMINQSITTARYLEALKEDCYSQTTICELLTSLCETYTFQDGMIYEVNQFNVLLLKEHTVDPISNSHKNIPLDTIQPYIRQEYKKSHLCCWNEDTFMSDFFCAHSMILFPIMDKKEQILGLLVFRAIHPLNLHELTYATLMLDITLLSKCIKDRMYENKISFAIKSLEDILDHTGIDIYVNDFYNHDILYVNKSMAAPYGGIEAFMERKCWEVLFPGQSGQCEFCPQKNLIDECGNPTKVYTWDYQRAFDGSWFRVFSSAFPWIDGRMAHVVSSADITDNKNYEKLIHHMANYDELTNLPNRRMLIEECERRIHNATSTENGYVLFFDIDGFKAINDTYGHDAGDEFLIGLGKYFSEIPLLKNSIYRNGGDEFVAVVGGEHITKDHIKNLSFAILSRFQKPWRLKKGDIYCSTSIGVACYPEDGNRPEDLIRIADQAMYKVKNTGGANIIFGHELK